MQVILKENVIGLGFKDEIVTVKGGYGRNYLIPTGKAVIASKSAVKALEEELKQRAHKLAKLKEDAQTIANKIENINPITIAVKVSATGTIYGSVNAQQISEALKEQGIEVDRKLILVKDVKELGAYTAVAKLHKEVSAEIPFTVVAENAAVETPAEEVETPAEAPAAPAAEEAPEAEAPAAVEAQEETPVEEA